MPTYQYACTECGHRFDAVQSFTDAALTECPQCTGRLRKVFNSVGIVFKGSGFYRTDSREKPAEKPKDSSDAKVGGTKDGAAAKDQPAAAAASSSASNGSSGSSGSSNGASGAKPAASSTAGSAA